MNRTVKTMIYCALFAALLDALYSLGAKRDSDPLIALSFMALPVIPAVKLTDEGLFDAVNFKFIKYN